jgi:PTS system nitrogen regulatory IIA component
MEIGLAEAAQRLGVSAETVERWARQGRLGVLRPSGEFRVGEDELVRWAEVQGLRLHQPVATAAAAPASALPPLQAALSRGCVLVGIPGATPGEVLRALAAAAPLAPGADREALVAQLEAREQLASTGLGAGVALPHPRTPSRDFVAEPVIVIGLLAQPVDWRALAGAPVRTAILLVSPTPQAHLQVLSRLAFLLREPRFAQALAAGARPEEILRLASLLEPPPA